METETARTNSRELTQQREALERERMRIQSEIASYPMPIPACDAHFNFLLAERERVCAELSRIDALVNRA